jgi:hypothetical protein
MSNIRPTYPPKPSNPAQSQGAPAAVGGGRDPKVIRPENPGAPASPVSSQGSVPNVNR